MQYEHPSRVSERLVMKSAYLEVLSGMCTIAIRDDKF